MRYKFGLKYILILTVGCILALNFLLVALFGKLFIGKIYLMKTQQQLIDAFDAVDSTNEVNSASLMEVERKNIQIIIISPDTSEELYNTRASSQQEDFSQNLVTQIQEGLANAPGEHFYLSEREIRFKTTSGTDLLLGRNITLDGILSSGNYIEVSASYEPIVTSAAIALSFTLFTGLATLLLGLILISKIAGIITTPVEQMNVVAKRISEFDFSSQCEVTMDNEISDLAKSINKISTDMQKYISELKQANQNLIQDISKREQLEQARKNLISNISHDLKTPISIISGYAEGLKVGMARTDQQKSEYCDVICDEADRMLQLIAKFLELNRLESGVIKLDMEEFDVTEVLDSLIQMFSINTSKRGVTIEKNYVHGATVFSDCVSVEQILTNYIQNAIQFVDDGGIIRISVAKNTNSWSISVFNTGSHISDEDLSHIWESFYKSDRSRQRQNGESGLGLAIVRGNMQLLGMPYGAENLPDGVEFYITLPMPD